MSPQDPSKRAENPRREDRHGPLVAIIVLNWNGAEDSIECLRSLEGVDGRGFRVLFVDNGSSDDSVARVRAAFPELDVLETGGNLGFAGGVNRGIERALEWDAAYVLLLNNDTVVDRDSLTALVAAAEEDPRLGIVAPLIYFADQPTTVWYGGGDLSLRRGGGYHRHHGRQDPGLRGIERVSFVTGCAMLLRREMVEEIGLLDERYFLQMEDADYSYRALRGGWRLAVCFDAKIWHRVASSMGGRDAAWNFYYSARSRLFFAYRSPTGIVNKLLFTLFFFPSRIGRFAVWLLQGRPGHVRATLAGISDYFRGRMGWRAAPGR